MYGLHYLFMSRCMVYIICSIDCRKENHAIPQCDIRYIWWQVEQCSTMPHMWKSKYF